MQRIYIFVLKIEMQKLWIFSFHFSRVENRVNISFVWWRERICNEKISMSFFSIKKKSAEYNFTILNWESSESFHFPSGYFPFSPLFCSVHHKFDFPSFFLSLSASSKKTNQKKSLTRIDRLVDWLA